MTNYVAAGPAGTATPATSGGAYSLTPGSGNTLSVATDKVYTGSFALKLVMGTTALAAIDYQSDRHGAAVTGAVPYGAASDVNSGMFVFWYPVGGAKTAAGGINSLTSMVQFYGGTDDGTTVALGGTAGRIQLADAATGLTTSGSSVNQTNVGIGVGDKVVFTATGGATNITAGTTYYVVTKSANAFSVATTPGGTALVLGTASGVAYAQSLRFANNAGTSVLGIHGDMSGLEGHWVGVRWQLSLGGVATGGRAFFRAYDLGTNPLFPAVGSFLAGSDVSTAAVTGSGASATGGIDLGGTGGATPNKLTRVRTGVLTVQAAGFTTWLGYNVVTPGSLQWVAGPSASAAPGGTVTVNDSYPGDGDTITVDVSGVTNATSRTVSFAAPPSDHPTYGRWSDQSAFPAGTTAPVIQNATPTGTTTIGPVRAGQLWIRVRSVGAGGTTDTYVPVWVHADDSVDVKPQKVYGTGYTVFGGGTAEAALGDQSADTGMEGPTVPTAADFNLIMWQPMPLGTVKPSLTYRRKVNAADTTSGLRWNHQLLDEDGTLLYTFPTWDNPGAEAGQVLTRSFDPADIQSQLAALASKRALYSKVWSTVI